MSTVELNKIIGACLTAGLIGMIAFVTPKLLFEGEGGHGERSAKVEASAEAEGGKAGAEGEKAGAKGQTATEAEQAPVPAGVALAKANAENGEIGRAHV